METIALWMIPMNYPARLVKPRKQNGFTQQTLSDAALIHVYQIKRYEGGTAQLTLNTLVRLVKVFRISLDKDEKSCQGGTGKSPLATSSQALDPCFVITDDGL